MLSSGNSLRRDSILAFLIWVFIRILKQALLFNCRILVLLSIIWVTTFNFYSSLHLSLSITILSWLTWLCLLYVDRIWYLLLNRLNNLLFVFSLQSIRFNLINLLLLLEGVLEFLRRLLISLNFISFWFLIKHVTYNQFLWSFLLFLFYNTWLDNLWFLLLYNGWWLLLYQWFSSLLHYWILLWLRLNDSLLGFRLRCNYLFLGFDLRANYCFFGWLYSVLNFITGYFIDCLFTLLIRENVVLQGFRLFL